MKKQRIALIGAGTAGLAAAALLGRQGHEVTVIERAPALSTVGAGIMLQPSGIGVLAELGCLDEILRYGHRIDALYGAIPSGRFIMQVEYAHLSEDIYGLGIHRASLCHVLDQTLAKVPHRRWFGCAVESIDRQPDEAIVNYTREGHADSAAFDAVLVANGSASQLRPKSLVKYDRQYPWGAMWLIRPLGEDLSVFDKPHLQQRYAGSSVMIGALPTGRVPGDERTKMMSLFWSLPVAEMAQWHAPDFDFDGWKRQIAGHWPELLPLINRIASAAEMLPATYRDVIMKRWGEGRIGVIGDAAHAMSPQLGQGANMALLDALAVTRAVDACDNWNEVWPHFHDARKGSIRFYQHMSRLLTPLFQSRIFGAGLARDIGMPVSSLVPWLRRQMAETVSGRKQGWL